MTEGFCTAEVGENDLQLSPYARSLRRLSAREISDSTDTALHFHCTRTPAPRAHADDDESIAHAHLLNQIFYALFKRKEMLKYVYDVDATYIICKGGSRMLVQR